LMCAKNHLLIFSSFLDIWENVEWPRFFWTTLYMHVHQKHNVLVIKRNLIYMLMKWQVVTKFNELISYS